MTDLICDSKESEDVIRYLKVLLELEQKAATNSSVAFESHKAFALVLRTLVKITKTRSEKLVSVCKQKTAAVAVPQLPDVSEIIQNWKIWNSCCANMSAMEIENALKEATKTLDRERMLLNGATEDSLVTRTGSPHFDGDSNNTQEEKDGISMLVDFMEWMDEKVSQSTDASCTSVPKFPSLPKVLPTGKAPILTCVAPTYFTESCSGEEEKVEPPSDDIEMSRQRAQRPEYEVQYYDPCRSDEQSEYGTSLSLVTEKVANMGEGVRIVPGKGNKPAHTLFEI